MATRLQRHLGRVESLEPAQYTKETVTGATAICCPACGGISDLDRQPDENGRVVPAWKCPLEPCPFWEWIELESFGEDVLT